MIAPAGQPLLLILSLLLVVPSSYAIGRVHQWYTHSLRRDVAFREGYDQASFSIFDMAVRHRTAMARHTAGYPRAAEQSRTRTIPRGTTFSGDSGRRHRSPR